MAERSAPRVRLPDAIPRKPMVPGPNSWAQQQQHQQRRDTAADPVNDSRPSNRDKYEHKPMPPPPPQSEAGSPHAQYLLQPKAYIQPAIPLIASSSNGQTQKNRAVTDPVAPKPLFAGRKASVTQLRRKYSLSKDKRKSAEEITSEESQPLPANHVVAEKAAQVLGLYSVPDNSRSTPPSSAPAAQIPDLFRTSCEDSREGMMAPARLVQSSPVPTRSTPVPTKRYLKENGLPDQMRTESSIPRQQNVVEHERQMLGEPEITHAHRPASGFLNPARIGMHSNVGEVSLVEGSGMHRVESFRGVIEDAPTSSGSDGNFYTDPYANASEPSTGPGQYTGRHPALDLYSPSNYGGVWENDPAVVNYPSLRLDERTFAERAQGHTLPPFTPMPKKSSSNVDTNRHYSASSLQQQAPNQNTTTNSNFELDRYSNYHEPIPSANSWASYNSRANSFMSPSEPPSARYPPHWRHHQNSNSVPSPPQNRSDFQRAGSISAALAQIDLTLHHHIDSAFGSLSRLITDKHDRAMDQTIRRLEDLEHAVSRGFKGIKSEIGDIRKNVNLTQGVVKDIKTQNDRNVECVQGLDSRLQALEKHVEEHACKCRHSLNEQSASEPESDHHQRSAATSQTSQRRTESAHAIVGQAEPRQKHHSGGSRTSNSVRASGNSSKRDRSNTVNSQQAASRMSDERSNRREYFAELGAARGPVPDIKDHPAYADRQHAQEQAYGYGYDQNGVPMVLNGLPSNNPTLSDGKWYQQAYGQHR